MTMKRRLLLFCSLAVALTVSITGIIYAGADQTVVDSIKSYMDLSVKADYQVSYENGLAAFTIYSEGSGRTTYQDIVCLKNIYDTVRQDTVQKRVNSLSIKIIDSKNDVIYDSVDNYINQTVRTTKSTDKKSLASIRSSIQAKVAEASALDLTKLDITTEMGKVKLQDTIIMEEGQTSADVGTKLLSARDELMLLTTADTCDVSQAEITLKDQNGSIMAYYIADYEFGTHLCWTDESIDLWASMHG